jgi:hypothetical protein
VPRFVKYQREHGKVEKLMNSRKNIFVGYLAPVYQVHTLVEMKAE